MICAKSESIMQICQSILFYLMKRGLLSSISLITATTFVLAIYCMGHGMITNEPLLPLLSIAWSLSHSGAILVLLRLTHCEAFKSDFQTLFVVVVAPLTVSQCLYYVVTLMNSELLHLHSYTSVTFYIVASIIIWYLFPKYSNTSHLSNLKTLVDFGRAQYWLNHRDIMLAKGAKNYIEIEAVGKRTTGLLRCTMKDFAVQHPNMVRIHRSTFVNSEHVSNIQNLPRSCLMLTLTSGKKIKVSSSYRDSFLASKHFIPNTDIPSQ